MIYALAIIGLILISLHLYRQYWLYKTLEQVYTAQFDGELYQVGETTIGIRKSRPDTPPSKTVICFPGFLEDMRYFQALYQDTECELILVNNANYHSPFPLDQVKDLDWDSNPYACGTIEYDGFYLGHVVQRLASSQNITLHGHSRGGAVVLEAGRQFPDAMREKDRLISAILEAPVLPQARVAGKGSEPLTHRIICYLLPVVLGLSRKASTEQLLKQPMMQPTNDLKTDLCKSVYCVAKNYKTCVINAHSIWLWQRDNAYEMYNNFAKITVVVGQRDDVLDNPSMIASAEQGARRNPGVSVVQTENTNHFISLEQPGYLQKIVAG